MFGSKKSIKFGKRNCGFLVLTVIAARLCQIPYLQISGRTIIEPWYKKRVSGFPSDCIFSKDMISDTGKYPVFAEISPTSMERFPFKNVSILDNMFSYRSKHLILNNIAGNKYGALVWNGQWINDPYMDHYVITHGIIIKEFDEAIYLSNNYMKMYAHWFLDLFAPFNLLPEDVKRNYPLITGTNSSLVAEIYSALGYDVKNLYQFPTKNDFVFVKRMHTVIGFNQVNGHIGLSMRKLRNALSSRLHLDSTTPTRYVLFNRKPNEMRYFENFNELFTQVSNTYNQFHWEAISTVQKNLSSTIKLWNSIKIVFAATGSTFANSIFMQNCSAACVHLINWYDTPAMQTCLSYGVKLFVSDTLKCKHFEKCKCEISIKSAIVSIGRALDYFAKIDDNNSSQINASDVNYTIISLYGASPKISMRAVNSK